MCEPNPNLRRWRRNRDELTPKEESQKNDSVFLGLFFALVGSMFFDPFFGVLLAFLGMFIGHHLSIWFPSKTQKSRNRRNKPE